MSDVMEPLDVVAVAPHPDDLEITCGATLAKLVRQGYRVGIIDLTSGEPTPRGSEEIRAKEAEAARKVLGVQVRINLGLVWGPNCGGCGRRFSSPWRAERRPRRPIIIRGIC
jgi:LmbE family N-acetylglucosaminyl deacetylase